MNHTRRKQYIILATRESPLGLEVQGLCEASFSMEWSRERVNLWAIEEDEYTGTPARECFKEWEKMLNQNWSFRSDNWKLRRNLPGKRTMFRKMMSDPGYKHYHPCGRSRAEYKWHWVNHYAIRCGKELKKHGWDVRVYRVGSKFCPVELDMEERRLMEKRFVKYGKYNWRNPRFTIKKTT